jgi:response regulator RpfG family c-di-GMP phosphodiesterase
MMPEVSGYDVLREMALMGTASELPVLVLTNFPDARSDEEKRLLEQGLVLDIVPKTAVHDNPQLLAHVLDWHIQAAYERLTRRPREARSWSWRTTRSTRSCSASCSSAAAATGDGDRLAGGGHA